MSPLVEANQLLYYQPGIEVRITPEMLCPFLPSAATLVADMSPATTSQLPYVSLVDLIVFKMDACGLRDNPQAKQLEARDAAALLERATEHSALDLTPDQRRVVDESLPDVLRCAPPARQSKAWWQARLMGRCDPDARKEATEVLSDMIQRMNMEDSNSSSSSSSTNSNSSALLGRSSSSSSKTSIHSIVSSSTNSSSSSDANFVTTSSPPPSHPHAAAQELSCSIPRRSRKFSTSQHMSPVKKGGSRMSVDMGRPKRHSQVLGSLTSSSSLPSNGGTNLSSDDASPSSPGLTLTARFESTPAEEKLVTDSYF